MRNVIAEEFPGSDDQMHSPPILRG
jgi:hypothetical protein